MRLLLIRRNSTGEGVALPTRRTSPLAGSATAGPARQQPLRVLLTNDEGFDAPGLRAAGVEVMFIARLTDQSAAPLHA